MKTLLLLFLAVLIFSCTKQSSEKPKFSIGQQVEFNNICPHNNCCFYANQCPTYNLPFYVDSIYPAPGYPGHLAYKIHDSTKPDSLVIRFIIDYDLQKYKK